MRLGKIAADFGYVVDLDDPDMVSHAKDAVYEDVMSAVKNNEVMSWIKESEVPIDASEGDIPEFLRDKENEDEY